MTRRVLRIFISSTAIDLIEYRDKIRDSVQRLDNLPIAMETFSAGSGAPADECVRAAAEADALICVVAHRYGYVPPKELGGDGERSITWLEVDAAKRAGKPVFAFLVDPVAPWTGVKEQDRLVSEPEDKATEILKSVRKLKEFKAYLERETTRALFSNPSQLAEYVTAAISKLNLGIGDAPLSTARIWKPLFCHALQPAPHFRGRTAHLSDLKNWLLSPVTPDRVLSVVAAGGTGKTALVNQALHAQPLPDRAGFFVWSFYEDSHTDAFFRAACSYFTGQDNLPAGGLTERLQLALSGDLPHVLVLDGLERVQNEGDYRRRGEMEDLQLQRFVRALAGGVGNARALVTSRFPLVDLDNFSGAGHRAIVLDDLERSAAIEVVRAWSVKGDDAALARLIEPLNSNGEYHALSVAVLASYHGNFHAPAFAIQDAKDSDDPKARRLHRILDQYAKALTEIERDLLARLSLFPRGVKVEILGWIVQSGSQVAGALIALADHQILNHLERLKKLGLVFRYEVDGAIVYSAHPFLREFFRGLLRASPQLVHESVRAKLAPSLESRPETKPSESFILDQYELLIEQSVLAGRVQVAFDLYRDGLGGYENLSKALGENARGSRILNWFVDSDFTLRGGSLSPRDCSVLVASLGLFAENLGDMAGARRAFDYCLRLDGDEGDLLNQSVNQLNCSELGLLAGHFSQALIDAAMSFSLATEAKDSECMTSSLSLRADASSKLGNIAAALDDFGHATELEGRVLYSLRGIVQADLRQRLGDRSGALIQTEANRDILLTYSQNGEVCRCDALLTRLLGPTNPSEAARHLDSARSYASRSGAIELQLRCFLAATELYLHLGDFPQSITEGEAGVLLADTCKFGWFSIDIRLSLAETYLAASEPRKALQNARNALDRSEQIDCQYAWGKADGLHFCGIAHLRLGERELARERLTAALEIRERLGHGRVEETRQALATCHGPVAL